MNLEQLKNAREICEGEITLLLATCKELENKLTTAMSSHTQAKAQGKTAVADEQLEEAERLQTLYDETLSQSQKYKEYLKVIPADFTSTAIPVDSTLGQAHDELITNVLLAKATTESVFEELSKHGIDVTGSSKMSEISAKIDLLSVSLRIDPPNPGAMIDKGNNEYNVTKINVKHAPDGKYFATNASYNSKVAVYTDNYVAWSVSSREIYFKGYNDTDNLFKKFTLPSYDTNNLCSAHNGDLVYAFNYAGTTNVINCHVYDLSGTDFNAPKETYPINDCNDIRWCDTIDGVITLLYKPTSSSNLFFGTYVLGDNFITQKTKLNIGTAIDISYDDKYFYIAQSSAYVYYADRALTFESVQHLSPPGISRCNCIVPINGNLILISGSNGARLHAGVDSTNPGGFIHTITSNYCNYGASVDDTYFVLSYGDTPYARLHRFVISSTGSYSTELVGTFNDITTSTMTFPGMVIAKDLLGKQYLSFTRYRAILIEGINSDIEFELERR